VAQEASAEYGKIAAFTTQGAGLTHLNFLARYFAEHFQFDIKIIKIKMRLPIFQPSNGQARVF
jgi:hypothetical protein